MKFIEWGFPVDIAADITSKIKEYMDNAGIKDAGIYRIEDQSYADPVNNRFDIEVDYSLDGRMVWQKRLYLKGEIVDGVDFHRRFKEFYPDRTEAHDGDQTWDAVEQGRCETASLEESIEDASLEDKDKEGKDL